MLRPVRRHRGLLDSGHGMLPGDGHVAARCGHENCPLTVMGSARHDVFCLAACGG